MAFRLGDRVDIPKSIEGTYLIPVAWLVFGLQEGNLSIDKKKFDNSLQGSVFRWWEDNKASLPLTRNARTTKGDVIAEVWLVYSGEGVVNYFYFPGQGFCNVIESDRIKSGKVYICGLNHLGAQTSNMQKTINSSMIQLFPGRSSYI